MRTGGPGPGRGQATAGHPGYRKSAHSEIRPMWARTEENFSHHAAGRQEILIKRITAATHSAAPGRGAGVAPGTACPAHPGRGPGQRAVPQWASRSGRPASRAPCPPGTMRGASGRAPSPASHTGETR